jgi:hypothetical protein
MNQCGFNTHVHGSNARNLSAWLFLSQASKNTMFFFSLVLCLTKLENKRMEQVLLRMGGGNKGEGSPKHVYTCK